MNSFPSRDRVVCWLLLLAAAIEFVWRGPLREVVTDDFAAPYASARAWTAGQDPYDSASLVLLLEQAGGHTLTLPLYPPGAFLLLSPLAQLPLPLARQVWLVLALALFGLSTAALMSLAQLSWRSPAGFALLTVLLALAPCHTGLANRQLALPAAGLMVLSSWQISRGYPLGGGVFLALALVLKPPLAAPLVLYHALRRRWAVVGLALGISGLITVVAAAWLSLHGVDWIEGWQANLQRAGAPGGDNDPRGPFRHHLIDLRPLAHALLGDAGTANALTLAAVLATGAVATVLAWRGPGAADELLGQSTLVVWGLLASYHRFYDAVLLGYPVTWAIRACRTGPRGPAWMVLATAFCFLVPGAIVLHLLQEQELLPLTLTDTGAWRVLIAPHQTWALGGMLLGLWLALGSPYRTPYRTANEETTSSARPVAREGELCSSSENW